MKQLLTPLLLVVLCLAACRHEPPVYLPACTFCDSSDFNGDEYSGTINFDTVHWGNKACYKNTTFDDSALFKGGVFDDTAVFTDASFAGYLDFSDVTFQKPVYFDNVSFAKQTWFSNTRFSHYAKFTNLQNTDSVVIQFADAILPDTLDFSQNSGLRCKIDLTTANFDRPGSFDSISGDYKHPHGIFLFNTDISKFQLDYFHFRLLLPDSTITPTDTTARQKITKDQKETIYEALLANFKKNGQEESYKRLDIEYQQFKWRNSWAHAISFVPAIWWNYGYDKEYVFLWIAGSLLVFIGINLFFLTTLNNEVYEIFDVDTIREKATRRKRIWYTVIYTANIFFRLTLDRKCMKFQKIGATFYFFVIYILGILCLGYLANFILQH